MMTHLISETDLIEQLKRRYAVKQFDPSKKLTDQQITTLLEVARLSPSSFGVQGRGFVVISNDELRKQLLPYSRGQQQIVDASHLIVLCNRTDVDTDFIARYIDDMAATRNLPRDELKGFEDMLHTFLEGKDTASLEQRLSKQVYISLGNLLTSCALLGIDACPMEGFDAKKYNEILGLDSHHLSSCVVVAVGHRSPDDKYAQLEKVRFPLEDLVVTKA